MVTQVGRQYLIVQVYLVKDISLSFSLKHR
jgi:hypothetical protein